MQLRREDANLHDLFIGMDSANIRNMNRILGPDAADRIHRLLDFTCSPRDVADPWYTDDFDTTFTDIDVGCRALLGSLP